jgi:thiol reductant ABC exporter CydD subunit
VRLVDPRLLRRSRPVRALLALDAALGLLTAGLVLVQAILIARIAARSFGGASFAELRTDLVLLVATVAARAATVWVFEVVGRRAAASVLSQLRRELVAASLGGRPAPRDGAGSAELATLAVGGVDALETVFARSIPAAVNAVVLPVAVLVFVASVDAVAAGVMLLTLPLVPVFMWLLGRHAERRTRERWESLSRLATHFLDVVRGLPTLRAFGRSRAQGEQIAAVSEEYRRATMGTLRVAFLSTAVLELAATLGIALVAVTVGVRLVDGGIGFEAALTVLVLAPELYLPLRTVAAQFHASADGLVVAGRLLDLVEAPTATTGSLPAPSPLDVPVRFEAVSFTYPGRPGGVLHGIELELAPGETVALVGPSGAGKSTIASLVLGLAEPTAGRVLVGDADVGDLDPRSWRSRIAWVPQRPVLFRGTVADNIRLGAEHAGDAAVQDAAALAGADGFVGALEQGYATVVGDGGRQLSTGERRRIALARAFLRDAPLLVLDEPTADLDPGSALVVRQAIERLRGRRTILLVAHRPELAELADRVVRLEGGRVLKHEARAA